ncbi:MAG: type II toxin-antitoxin system death-on-curing family toxin [Phycisphaerales bacterium]
METIHAEQIAEHGGLAGIRDQGSLDAALGRPRDKWGYGKVRDPAALAAAYAYGISSAHPFNDGNKRTAFLAMVVFLGLNGIDFGAPESEVVSAFTALAEGSQDESSLAAWIAKRSKKSRRRKPGSA